jgi:hypothetical protein
MSVTMRIVQRFDAGREREFMQLEQRFAALEASRPDYPKGKRLQPLAGIEPCNTLIWEAEFADLEAARRALDFFAGDSAHEELLRQQAPLFQQVRVEFYRNLDFVSTS